MATYNNFPQPSLYASFIPTSSSMPLSPNAIVECLKESRDIQLEILKEIKSLSDKSRQQDIPQKTIPKTIHEGIFCNLCNKQNIVGIRYKCLFCKDFDICEDCEPESFMLHDFTHVFIKIRSTSFFNMKMTNKPLDTPLDLK